MFDAADAKNRLMRSVAGGGMEQMSNLQARWDKFELMMESHQLMVKEQVCHFLTRSLANNIGEDYFMNVQTRTRRYPVFYICHTFQQGCIYAQFYFRKFAVFICSFTLMLHWSLLLT